MRTELWPDQTTEDMARRLSTASGSTLVAELPGGRLCGFVEVGERAVADGCSSVPVAYVEGLWVDVDARRNGLGTALLQAAERWAADEGYSEMASDTALDNEASHLTHRRAGFVEAGRSVQYAKRLHSGP